MIFQNMLYESKKRTLIKSILWRVFATINSYLVLCIGIHSNLYAAICINTTGFFIYYIYERVFNKITWGKEENEQES